MGCTPSTVNVSSERPHNEIRATQQIQEAPHQLKDSIGTAAGSNAIKDYFTFYLSGVDKNPITESGRTNSLVSQLCIDSPSGDIPDCSKSVFDEPNGSNVPTPRNVFSQNSLTAESCSNYVKFSCLLAKAQSKWPIRCYAPLKFNINSQHGGCCSLVFVSNAYGSEGCNTTAQIFLLRSGFNCNHFGAVIIAESHEDPNQSKSQHKNDYMCLKYGTPSVKIVQTTKSDFTVSLSSFGNTGQYSPASSFVTNEKGDLIVDCLFGSNHVMLMSNRKSNGHCGHGLVFQASDKSDEFTNCLLNVNGYSDKDHGGGCSLIICSAIQKNTVTSACYLIRSGHKGTVFQKTLIKGEDLWEFSTNSSSQLQVKGCAHSSYSLYHNRLNVVSGNKQTAKSISVSVPDGSQYAKLIELSYCLPHAAVIVLCSHSCGQQDATSATIYLISFSEKNLQVLLLSESFGEGCIHRNEWKFEMDKSSNFLLVCGPLGPARFSLISNIREDVSTLTQLHPKDICAVTGGGNGDNDFFVGHVECEEDKISGVMNTTCEVYISLNGSMVATILAEELVPDGSQWIFNREWIENEISFGLNLVQVFANVTTNQIHKIELQGSPYQLIKQPIGVEVAINCGGPSYQSVIDDIVYQSDHSQFANFSYAYASGSRWKCLGGIKKNASITQQITGTEDNLLYLTSRSPGVEAVEEQNVIYTFDNVSNGDYILRLHCLAVNCGRITVNEENISQKVQSQFHQQQEISPGYHAHTADVPVTITDQHLTICSKDTAICAFALLDPIQMKEYLETKWQKLHHSSCPVESVKSICFAPMKKEVKIAGWSQNLLQNASGEGKNYCWAATQVSAGLMFIHCINSAFSSKTAALIILSLNSMVHWNAYGDWAIHESGRRSEKAFITSQTRCTKHQEVDLTEFFRPEYLDNSPDIQVSEWHRDGVSGGGFYSMTASLMDENGTVIKQCTTGEIHKINENKEWQEASFIFSDYGPGVRGVAIESYGKDDKYLSGHYGTCMSDAMVRVKRESSPAANDIYGDIDQNSWLKDGHFHISQVDNILEQLLKDNNKLIANNRIKDICKETGEDNERLNGNVKQHKFKLNEMKKRREIRLFVSSVVSDFTKEKEELIQKTFQEINQKCMNQGVLFSYVDLESGISNQQNQHEKSIAVSLQEIDRCRPYFISLMGERFGWSQKEDKPDTALNESFDYAIEHLSDLTWLDECRYGISVTQLEILHAVLNDVSSSKERSFFYLRDQAEEQPSGDQENKRPPESEWHSEKQESLKNLIMSNRELNSRKYKTIREVCGFVKKDIADCLEKDFPKGSELSTLEQKWQIHQTYADIRRKVYVGGETYLLQIDDLMESSQSPVVIIGESGCGKSSLIANWCFRLEENEPDTFIFLHFIGSSPDSSSCLKMLHRLYEELKAAFGLELEIPFSEIAIRQEISNWVKLVGSIRKCVFVFDALNYLDYTLANGNAGKPVDLSWIYQLNSCDNVKVLLSTLPGKVCKDIKDIGWPCIQIEPLTLEQKSEIMNEYFEKPCDWILNSDQQDLITSSVHSDNPLFLRTLLSEIRVHGDCQSLNSTIHKYVIASCPRDLFCMILTRLEKDFTDESGKMCNVVRETTSAIWCTRRGMSENELRKLINIPSAMWSPFYVSIVDLLVNTNGIYNFFHDYLRQAVEVRFLPALNDKKTCMIRLADFFSSQPINYRVAEELPFLLYEAGEMERLKETLSDPNILQQLMTTESGRYDLKHYWKQLGDFNQVSQIYKEQVECFNGDRQSEEYLNIQMSMVKLFIDLALFDDAKKVLESLLNDYEKKYGDEFVTVVYCAWDFSWKTRCCHENVIKLLQLLGHVCTKQNDLEQAEIYYRELMDRLNNVKTWTQKLQLCEGCVGLATVLQMKNDMKESKRLLLRSVELSTEMFGHKYHYVAAIINKLGQLCFQQGKLDEALCYFLKYFKMIRTNVGRNYAHLATIINAVALIYDKKNFEDSTKLYECALAIMLNVFGSEHVNTAMIRYNLGTAYFESNYYARAKYQWQEALKVLESFNGVDHIDTITVLNALKGVNIFINPE